MRNRSIPSVTVAVLGFAAACAIAAAADPPSPPGGAPAAESPAAVPSPPPAAAGPDYVRDRDAIVDGFYRVGLDTTRAYAVSDLTVRKDNMVFLLKSGTLFLMKPIAGEVTGAAFVGDGEAAMTPPTRADRYMLKKYYGADVLKEPFTEAVFRFSDGSDRIWTAAAKPDPQGAQRAARAEEIFADRNSWLAGERNSLEIQFLENRLSNLKGQEFFTAEFDSPKFKWIGYSYNPMDSIENLLYVRESTGAKDRMYRVIWSDWHKTSDYSGGHYLLFPEKDGPQVLRIRHYDMDLNIPNLKQVVWECRMTVEPQLSNLRALRFDNVNNADYRSRRDDSSFYPVEITSVTDADGTPRTFMHRRDQLLVVLPQPTRAGEAMTLVVRGTAEVIYQVTAQSFGLLEDAWYPQYGYNGGRYSFHWKVRVPQGYLITGSGRVVKEFRDEATDQNGLETECDKAVSFPWIIFGRFQKATATFDSEEVPNRKVALTLHSFPHMTVPITDKETLDIIGAGAPISLDLTAPVKRVEGMLAEGKEILKLYEKIYGPYPYPELHVAQMAPFMGYGQAPQGFVQLTGEAFMAPTGGAQSSAGVGKGAVTMTYDFGDFIHGFIAHEFAHQWWGHQVGWAGNDDQWLSESFAEYASGLFVRAYQGDKRFQRTLEEWKRDARNADLKAPIAAANTLRGPNSGTYRTNLLYAKGPYVLHMLHVQMDDADYVKAMRAVLTKYADRNITTEMLLSEVNHVTGQDYTSFFDQWFWDVGIPKLRYSWRADRQADGKYLLTVHVVQEDKSHPKRMLLPIHIEAKGTKIPPQYKGLTEIEQDIKMLLPVEPKDVTLDDDHTLLADIVKAG